MLLRGANDARDEFHLAADAQNRVRSFRHWRWHLNELYVTLNGETVYLWRAVDHEGEVLASYVTKTATRRRHSSS